MPDATYAINIEYVVAITGQSMRHNHRFRVAPADASAEIAIGTPASAVVLKAGNSQASTGNVQLDIGLGDYLAAMLPMYEQSMSVTSASLIKYPYGLSGSGIYVTPIDLSDPQANYPTRGTSGTGTAVAYALTATFFDGRGKVSKLTLLETILRSEAQTGVESAPAPVKTWVNYVTGDTSIVRGVDGSDMLAVKLISQGQNEAVWRKRYR